MFKRRTFYEAPTEFLEELLEQAGDATHPPPLPSNGIPKRWFPSIIGKIVKGALLPFVSIDIFMKKVARIVVRPPFKKEGKCKKRGNCCHYILIHHKASMLGYLFYFWYTQIHGFYLRYKDPHFHEGKAMFVMGCRYLKKDGSCGQYRLRPAICREWPVIEHFGYPKILKGCGFRSNPPDPYKHTEESHYEGHSKLNVLN